MVAMKGESVLLKNIFWLFVLSFFQSNAQQDPLFTQYMYNMNIINPAYAGSVEAAEFGLNTRAQWVNFEGSPKTLTFAFSTPVPVFENFGMGLSLVSDRSGPLTNQDIYLDFSYQLQIHSTGALSLGLKAGNTLSFFDNSYFTDDPAYRGIENSNHWNVGAGVYYQDRSIYVSLSVPQLFNYEQELGSELNSMNRQVYLSAGYVYTLERYLQIKPSMLVRYSENEPVSFDINTNLLWYETFETGVSYRYNSSVSLLFNMKVMEPLRVGYSFDYGIGPLMGANATSHEIFLLYDLQSKRQRFTSPRFF